MSQVAEATADPNFERIPPHNNDAEMSVLGGMLMWKDAIAEVVGVLRADDFYRGAHQRIFTVIMDLFARGEPVDGITVQAELRNRGELEKIGGAPYIHSLISSVPSATNTAWYAHLVRQQSQLRALVDAGTRIAQLGYNSGGGDVEELVNLAQAEVYAISEKRASDSYAPLKEVIPDVEEELKANQNDDGTLRGLSTGFSELDAKLNGLRAGQMIIVAARPGAGKSTLAMDFCRAAAIHNGVAAAYFSLEMSRNELAMRMLAAESNVFLDSMIKGKINQEGWNRIQKTTQRIENAPLLIDDAPNLTLGEIRAKSRRMKQQYNIGLIVIDYLQLLTSGGSRIESRQQEVSDFSRAIKLLAKELEVPIIAVAQLNRNPEGRTDKRPQVSDLRESGSLEQDADVILLIHREDMYSESTERKGMAEIIIGKQRSGPTGTVELSFQGDRARFAEPGSGPMHAGGGF